MPRDERRRRRSQNITRALRYQLDACQGDARLDGMVLSDEDGLTLAAAGDDRTCDEVAAHLPLIGRKVESFEGVLLSSHQGMEVAIRRFRVFGSDLYLAAIGGRAAQRKKQLSRSRRGVARILKERPTPRAAAE